MSFFLANPWGLLALLAIPAIITIHLLQEKSRRVRTSTLFLLEHSAPTSDGGFRIERFRNSLPFWMQILAACALAWLLADPRWVVAEPRQTVAVVLDSSASMQAFRQETIGALVDRLGSWDAVAKRTDWHLLETGPRRPPLYAGDSLEELIEAVESRWNPVLGSHSPSDAIIAARALVPAEAGCVIFVTDRVSDVPADIAVLSKATASDNVGFSGGRVDTSEGKSIWRVLITNYSDSSQTRELTLRMAEADNNNLAKGKPLAAPQKIELSAGQSRTFTGEWPVDAADRIVLTLSEDRLPIDNLLPLVKPVHRTVRVANRLEGSAGELLGKMLTAVEQVVPITDEADVDLIVDRIGISSSKHTILVGTNEKSDGQSTTEQSTATPSLAPGWVSAEDHALVRELGWGGLLSGPADDIRLLGKDTPLLWKDSRPLAFLRSPIVVDATVGESLVLNWDIASSNAARTPAVVVMIARFVEHVREQIRRSWADNFETGQAIMLPGGEQIRAPETPGFFTASMLKSIKETNPEVDSKQVVATEQSSNKTSIASDLAPALLGAAQFTDARESDLRGASPVDTVDAIRLEQIVKKSVEDPWAPLWIALAAAALLLAWSWRRRS